MLRDAVLFCKIALDFTDQMSPKSAYMLQSLVIVLAVNLNIHHARERVFIL